MWSLGMLLVSYLGMSVTADTYNADMENTGVCTMPIENPRIVKQYDIYNIYAEPRQDGKGTRDRCTIRLQGEGGRKFKFCIRDLKFGECQVFIRVYDGIPEANVLNTAHYSFGCNSGTGTVYTSLWSDISVSLEKPDSSSTSYKFYIQLATEDGPDVCKDVSPQESRGDSPMSAGVIAGIVIAAVLVVIVMVAVAVFLIFAYRRKQEEKEAALAHSMSSLLPSAEAVRGGSSAHSSVHSSVHSSKHSMYPAFRTTISEKHGTCNSIDTRSYDSDQVDTVKISVRNGDSKLKPAIKYVGHEFDSMRRGLQRENVRKAREEEEWRHEEARRREHQQADRRGRAESNRGLGRSNRPRKDDRLILTDENLKNSLRQARDKGRSYDDKSSHKGSTRSTKSRNKSHSPSRSADNYRYRADSDYNHSDRYGDDDDRERDRGRSRSRSLSSRPTQRASSTGSYSRRKRDYFDDRDNFSDNDDRRRRHRHDSRERDRYSEDEYRSRRDSSSHRSGTQRSRTQSTGRRKR